MQNLGMQLLAPRPGQEARWSKAKRGSCCSISCIRSHVLAIKVNYFGNTAAHERARGCTEIANAALTIGSILFDFDAV